MGVGAVAVGEGEALLEALSVAGEEEGRALAVELTPHLGLGEAESVPAPIAAPPAAAAPLVGEEDAVTVGAATEPVDEGEGDPETVAL